MANLKIHIPIINGPSGDQLCTLFCYGEVMFFGSYLDFTVESSWLHKHAEKSKTAYELYNCISGYPSQRLDILEINSLAIAPVKVERSLWRIEIIGKFKAPSRRFRASASYSPKTRKGMLYCGELLEQ